MIVLMRQHKILPYAYGEVSVYRLRYLDILASYGYGKGVNQADLGQEMHICRCCYPPCRPRRRNGLRIINIPAILPGGWTVRETTSFNYYYHGCP